jgi:hypothetical protein
VRELKIISVVDNHPRFVWEVDTFLTNLEKFGYEDKAQILIFCRENEDVNEGWLELIEKFGEKFVEFYFYEDTHRIQSVYTNLRYIPLLRLYTLREHFKAHPELVEDAIFYCDSDIVFLKYLDFSPFLDDDINYLSWTGSPDRLSNYIWSDYFDSKIKDVLPDKLKDYQKIDVLQSTSSLCGINRRICEDNRLCTGGAQYLLKNITSEFWNDCFESCCTIRVYLREFINIEYFKNEDAGFQSWCADMWALLWHLWKRGDKTICPSELDFSWSTDLIDNKNYILHNAGITGDSKIRTRIKDSEGNNIMIDAPAFYKGNYATNPPDMETLLEIINHPISKTYYTSVYCEEILNSFKTKIYEP